MNQATFIQPLKHNPYAHYIRSMAEDSWWVYRYEAQFNGQALPASRVVFFARSLDEAERWIKGYENA